MNLGFQTKIASKIAINTAPPTSNVFSIKCKLVKKSIKRTKNAAIYLLVFLNQIKIPPNICKTPNVFQSIGDIESIKEHGGSK